MSQFNAPPPPPGSMPPGYGPPVGYGMPTPQRTSVAAIISLISGILGCFIITGVIAVISGIVGIKATSNPNVKGRGLAITGIILGLLLGLVSTGIVATSYWGVGKLKQVAGEAVRPVISSLVEGDAETIAASTSMTPAEVVALQQQVKDWGKVTAVSMGLNGMNAQSTNGRNTIEMKGTATFEKAGEKAFRVFLDDGGGAGKLKVKELKFE